jgi:predicted  nucleic acid-binding Zn-ribbon protein
MAMSSGSTARVATMRRIADLEAELTAARREREALESGLATLRGNLNLGLGLTGARSRSASPTKYK